MSSFTLPLLAERCWLTAGIIIIILIILIIIMIIIVVIIITIIIIIIIIIMIIMDLGVVLFSFRHRFFARPTEAFFFPAWNHRGKYMVVIDDSRELHWPTVFPCCCPKVTAHTNGTTRRTKKSVVAKRQEDKWRNLVNTRKQFSGELCGVTKIVPAVLMDKLESSLPLSQS